MAKCISVYSGHVLEHVNKIVGNHENIKINVLYFNPEYGFYWYLNNRGFYHVIKIHSVKHHGEVQFMVFDKLLCKNGLTKTTKDWFGIKSQKDAIKLIHDNYDVEEICPAALELGIK